eukprot:13862655-Alexandrium_andersonii.AAC.1
MSRARNSTTGSIACRISSRGSAAASSRSPPAKTWTLPTTCRPLVPLPLRSGYHRLRQQWLQVAHFPALEKRPTVFSDEATAPAS